MNLKNFDEVKSFIRPVLQNIKLLILKDKNIPNEETVFPDIRLSLKIVKAKGRRAANPSEIEYDEDVTTELLQKWNVSFSRALEIGKKNLAAISKFGDIQGEIDVPEEDKMYILSARDCIYGAAACLNNGFFDYVHDMLGDYYILPSSVHELLFVRADSMDKENVNAMVQGVNNDLPVKMILSDKAYFWDKTQRKAVS